MTETPEEIGGQVAEAILSGSLHMPPINLGWALNYVASTIRAERAAAVKSLKEWMTEQGFSTGTGDTMSDLLSALDWQLDEIRRLPPVEEVI